MWNPEEEKDIVEIVKRFSNCKVVVVGDIFLDQYIFGDVLKLNPERKSAPLLRVLRDEFRLGGAANVAHNISSFGASCFLSGITGKDIYMKKIDELCKSANIKLMSYPIGESIVKQRIIEEDLDDYIMRLDMGERELRAISKEIASEILKSFTQMGKLDAIILSDYNKSIFKEEEFINNIISFAKNKGIFVVSAPKPENARFFFGTDLMCLNLDEAGQVTGIKGYDKRREIALKLFEMTKSKNVIITCGKHGMCVYDGEFHDISTKAREVVDVTGAGDTVVSVLTLALISGGNVVKSSKIANYAAGIVVEKQGTAVSSINELMNRIKSDSRGL